MLVTSLGFDAELGHLMSEVTQYPGVTRFSKLDIVKIAIIAFGLPISILSFLSLHFERGNEEISGNLKKENRRYGILILALGTWLLRVMGARPYLIIPYIHFRRNNMLSDKAFAEELLAWVRMGSVSHICINKTVWQELNPGTVEMDPRKSKEIEDLKNAGITVIVVSEDKVSRLEATGLESNESVLEGQDFRNYSNEARMNMVENIMEMRCCSASDKLLLVKCLKKRGKRVAMVGGKTNEIPALKEADVGIVMKTSRNEMARESSDIIIENGELSYLVKMVNFGRCVCDNIRKYTQFQLAMTLAGLAIPTITTLWSGYSPIPATQILWTNAVASLLGGLALMAEPPAKALMDMQPQRQTNIFIAEGMWRNIVIQALYQTVILVLFQYKGQAFLDISKEVSDTIIFNTFVVCQVYNIIDARELKKKNVFRGIHHNPWLWVAWVVILMLQVAFIEISHRCMGTAILSPMDWLVCLLIVMILLLLHWPTKYMLVFILDRFWPWLKGFILGRSWTWLACGTRGMTSSTPSASAANSELQVTNK